MDPTSRTRPRRSAWCCPPWVVLLAAPLVLGAAMDVDAERATLAGVEGPACPLGSTVGEAACPGCGLTRSTALVVQGRWETAFSVHPAGFAIAGICLLGLALAAVAAGRGRGLSWWPAVAHWSLWAGLAIGWGWKLWRACG